MTSPPSPPVDTNRCSWSDGPHDEHTFGFESGAGSDPAAALTMAPPSPSATVDRPVRRRTHRAPTSTPAVFRPTARPAAPWAPVAPEVLAPHRARPVRFGCDDPRARARAAALRRRHVLLTVVAVALVALLASPWT